MPMPVGKTVLDNGVVLLSERVPWLHSVTAGIWVPAGSRNESRSFSGVSHFIEHLLFKGTGRRSALDISLEIESVGGHINAFTDREYTAFHAKALSRDFPLLVDILSDMLVDPSFDPVEYERERGVVLQEILMVDDNPEEFLHDAFQEFFYGDHPLGFPIQGTTESVGSFERDAVATFFRDLFRRQGMVVTVVGNLPHDEVVAAFSKTLGGLQLGPPPVVVAPSDPIPGVCLKERDIEQVQICLGAPALRRTSEERYASFLMNTVLGGSTCSRLFQEVREKRGLAYSVYSSLSPYADAGVLKIGAGTTPDQTVELLDVVGTVLDDLARGGVTDEEVERARAILRCSVLMGEESPDARMSRLALSEIFAGRYESPEEAIARIDATTPDEVRAVATRLLPRKRFSMAAVGKMPDAVSSS